MDLEWALIPMTAVLTRERRGRFDNTERPEGECHTKRSQRLAGRPLQGKECRGVSQTPEARRETMKEILTHACYLNVIAEVRFVRSGRRCRKPCLLPWGKRGPRIHSQFPSLDRTEDATGPHRLSRPEGS